MINLDELADLDTQERAANGSAAFEQNAFLERIERMAMDDPRQFALMSPSLRLSVSYYSAARRRAEMMNDEASK